MTVEQADERAAALDAHCGALRSALEQLAGEDDPARQQGLATAGSLALLDIKGAHRGVFEAAEAARGATAAAKEGLEALSLQLANLLYQRRHHESDIAACLDARSAYTAADISLLSVEEFHATASSEWAAKTAGGDHGAMLARLGHEAATRQKLLAELQRARGRKDALAAAVAQKRRFADWQAAEVGNVLEAAAALRDSLNVAPPGVALPARAAELPLPLYVLATQLLAAQGEFDTPIGVSVMDCQPAAAAEATPATGSAAVATETKGAAEPGEAADTDMADADGDDASDAEPGEAEEAVANGNGAASADAPSPAAEGIPTEPLAVELVLGAADARLLTITFAYAAQKHKVFVSGADGDESRALASLDSSGGKASAAPPKAAPTGPQPYRWAQQLAGLDFLAPPPAGGVAPTAGAADGHVLAGLAEHRSGKRALKALEALRAAQRAAAVAPAAAAAAK